VGHSDDLNFIAANEVHEAEGIAGKDVPTNTIAIAWPRLRICGDRVDGLTYLFAEAAGG